MTAGLARLLRLGGAESLVGRTILVGVVVSTVCVRLWTLPPNQKFEEFQGGDWPRMRAYMIQQLSQFPGEDLVLVAASAEHLMFQNWIHNGADLDDSPVLFARDLALPLESNPLLDYYPDRRIWHLEFGVETWTFREIERPEHLAGS
jgi:hypothetical protein